MKRILPFVFLLSVSTAAQSEDTAPLTLADHAQARTIGSLCSVVFSEAEKQQDVAYEVEKKMHGIMLTDHDILLVETLEDPVDRAAVEYVSMLEVAKLMSQIMANPDEFVGECRLKSHNIGYRIHQQVDAMGLTPAGKRYNQ